MVAFTDTDIWTTSVANKLRGQGVDPATVDPAIEAAVLGALGQVRVIEDAERILGLEDELANEERILDDLLVEFDGPGQMTVARKRALAAQVRGHRLRSEA